MLWAQSRVGVFSITTDIYILGKGWEAIEEENLIVGETYDTYVTRFLTCSHGWWDGEEQYEIHYTVPVGIHKSRFIRWKTTQLELFK